MSVETIGAIEATTLGTQLTAPGSINTKAAWTQLSASTSANCNGVIVAVLGGGADGDVLFDVGTGASSSEVVKISNIAVRATNTSANHLNYFYFPLSITSGTRVAARYQASSTSCSLFMILYLTNDAGIIFNNCSITTYGADTTDSGATGIDPGGTNNTKGSYTQITASTTDDIDWLYVVCGDRNNAGIDATYWWFVDIATGGAGAETVVISDILFHAHSNEDYINPAVVGPFPVTIASGTRIAARAQALNNDATDRLIDISILGFNGSAAAAGGGASFSAHIK